ncbi:MULTISPECIES: response regulator transcription factor [Bacillota]|jgi:DNA-binding response OmpR family regulator|uniref:Response regulator transcription factor n=2 Tax=Amedibacillus TaxID=2749846 RepID=A0A7G9GMC5_9FIRM|nr:MULTISPECIES: response regulator transcription factor [Bacillota]QNM11957.1 response regulator transcription factor [[Eubacterium] hominis]MCH4287292.1 response regulator transcription factor [Amedibacillus hominis]RGB50851.1 DNA-binding response regulator [Absiella sp. AM22-9]RGB56437.1 DNA-binding response regulator [Absiella sp. AM10-20]RGB64530.1 DNA-binding response regulator [Absiella sp. AM09-45]
MAKILLIEDEENIRKIIAYDLIKSGYDITECGDGKEAIEQVMKEDFDVLIIDWMLPHYSGIDIVKKLRSEGKDSIMIMLTARDDESDILYAFEQGVDDYVTKPFSPRELLARVNAHLKRQQKKQDEKHCIGDLIMDMKRREAFIKDEQMTLTKKEFDLLEYFVQNKNIVLSRDSILNDIWGFDYDGDTRIVDVHVFKLRNKLNGSSVHIKSSRGVGYLLEEKHEAE